MNRRHRCQQWIVFCLLAAMTATGAPRKAKQPEPVKIGEGAASALVVPDLSALRAIAQARTVSALPRDLRLALFKQIETMSVEHFRVFSNAAGKATLETKADDWAARRAPSQRIPAQDRAIIASLLLQTDLLEGALEKRDSGRLENLRKHRDREVVGDKQAPVFGDLRDHVFRFCVKELQVIAELQAALGAGNADDGHKPATARTPKEAEACLLDGVTRLAQRSKRIP